MRLGWIFCHSVTLIVLSRLCVKTVILQFKRNYVNRVFRILGIVLVVSNAAAFAADAGDQAEWNYCNDKGRNMAGPAWKSLMNDCLAGKPKVAHKSMIREELMRQCKKGAAARTVDDRKVFLNRCLQGSAN